VQTRRRFQQPAGGQAAHVAQSKSDTWRLQGERGRIAPRGRATRVRDLHDGGPDVLFGGKENVIEAIFEKLRPSSQS
jgi:hypothetical protein